MKKLLFLCLLIAPLSILTAQVAINTDGSAPDPKAMLDIKSTTKGVLLPRMTTTQRFDMINGVVLTPLPEGLLVYDTDTKSIWQCINGFTWLEVNSPFGVKNTTNLYALNGAYSMSIGNNTVASGTNSFSTGLRSSNAGATGNYAVAMGYDVAAVGSNSFATGYQSQANGDGSIALGNSTTGAFCDYAVALGRASALGRFSLALGSSTANGQASMAFGLNSTANSQNSIILGHISTTSGLSSMVLGHNSTAAASYSTVLGHNSTAAASYSMALGYNSTANAAYSTVLGVYNDPIVAPTNAWNVTDPLLIVGNGTSTTPSNALVILKNGNTKISGSLATGTSTASGLYSTALGQSEATGTGSFAVGSIDVSDGGRHSIASGDNSTALGESTASGYGSTALGVSTASGASSFSLGYLSTASGNLSIASGWASTASGSISSASGVHSTASGDFSTASGIDITSRAYACVSIGKFNDSIASSNTTTWVSTDPIFIIGNGAASSSRSNAYVFYKNGNATMAGTLVQNSDRRLKRDFTPLSNPLDKVLKINGLHYYWSDADRSKNLQTGVIAQEVQAVMPELVEADNKGILSVNYNGIIPYLIESIKILKKENDDLKAKVSKMDALQAKVDELDALKAEVEKIKNAVYGRAEKH